MKRECCFISVLGKQKENAYSSDNVRKKRMFGDVSVNCVVKCVDGCIAIILGERVMLFCAFI